MPQQTATSVRLSCPPSAQLPAAAAAAAATEAAQSVASLSFTSRVRSFVRLKVQRRRWQQNAWYPWYRSSFLVAALEIHLTL
jgi:hypothetical protein